MQSWHYFREHSCCVTGRWRRSRRPKFPNPRIFEGSSSCRGMSPMRCRFRCSSHCCCRSICWRLQYHMPDAGFDPQPCCSTYICLLQKEVQKSAGGGHTGPAAASIVCEVSHHRVRCGTSHPLLHQCRPQGMRNDGGGCETKGSERQGRSRQTTCAARLPGALPRLAACNITMCSALVLSAGMPCKCLCFCQRVQSL